jgi:hypothetical protein
MQERIIMKRLLAACAIAAICVSPRLLAQSEAGHRSNIGKMAFAAAGGAELGRITDVAMMNGVLMYRITRDGRVVNVPVETVVAKAAPLPPAKTTPAATAAAVTPEAQIEPVLERTAADFREGLAQSGGTLQALGLTSKGISARWSSTRCRYFESEIIDLLLSIKRTQKASPAISGTSTCSGKIRTFTIKGEAFHQYRTGEIGEAQILAAIK